MSVGTRAAAVYVASSVIVKGLGFITLPVFTRLMAPDQIGVVNLYNSWHAILAGFAALSLTSGGFMIAMKDFADERDSYTSSVLTLTSLISLLLLAVLMLFPEWVCEMLGLPFRLCLLMAFSFLFLPAVEFWLGRQRYEYRYKAVAAYTIVVAIASTAASVLSVCMASSAQQGSLGEIRLISGNLITYGAAAFIWLALLIKGKTFVKVDYWKYSLALSLPLMGHSVAMQVLSASDRVMIGARAS